MSLRLLITVGAAACAGVLLLTGVLLVWLATFAGAGGGSAAAASSTHCADQLDRVVPEALRPIFVRAAGQYELGADGPAILAALTSIESGFGRNMGPSSAGAIGWTQFLPSTWEQYGVDADGDGRRNPYDADDAIHASAHYLRANGAPSNWRRALFAYNHADWYVNKVLAEAERLGTNGAGEPCSAPLVPLGVQRLVGGRIVAIPGMPGETIDERIVGDVVWMIEAFHVRVTDGYATSGHDADGEHPLGLAVDLEPGAGGTWDDIDRLAMWAEPLQGAPRAPFRWVGYDGDANHGRGDHLHLSWRHAPTPLRRPPAAWVEVIQHGG